MQTDLSYIIRINQIKMKRIISLILSSMIMFCLVGVGCTNMKEPLLSDPNAYYVATDGNDSNPGTIESPLLTIKEALNKALPGYTILVRGGTYNEKVIFTKSGTNNLYITLKAYPNEKPIIDGTGLSVAGKEALITIRNVKYINIEGFDICNYKSTKSGVIVNGITVNQGSGDITIRKNKIYNIEHNVSPEEGRNGHGIEILGNTNVAIKNIIIEDNEIHDCNTGYSENLTINGYVDGFVIKKNRIFNGENIGIVAAGGYSANSIPALNYARNGIICDNEVYNMDGTSGPIPAYQQVNGAIGIYVDGARDIIVERNKVHDNGRGIGIVSETNNFPTENCIVRNNFVYNNSLAGIYLGGYVGYTTGGTNNCAVVNNTLYYNNKSLGYSNEIEGEIRLTENCTNNIIKNNILFARQNKGIFINKQTKSGSNNSIDYNLYFSQILYKWVWDGAIYTNFNEWQSACNGDAASIKGLDPQLLNIEIPDIHILGTSPAVKKGIVISTYVNGETDIDGNSRILNNKIDIGATQIN
jgi:parallel beta-helix repeat protein